MDIVISTCDGSYKFEFESYKMKKNSKQINWERGTIPLDGSHMKQVPWFVTAKMQLERSTTSSYSYDNKSAADSMVRL